jgi:hypothetical protein
MPRETLVKELFAEAYGFTEEMTEESSLDAVVWWPEIRAARNDAERKKAKDTQ